MKVVPDQLAPWLAGRMETLGTDGFGRSDNREYLRKHFEINAESIAAAALSRLARDGKFDAKRAQAAFAELHVDTEKARPGAGVDAHRAARRRHRHDRERRAGPGQDLLAGLHGHSTAVVADGLESASDVFASGFVLLGLTLAAKPADAEHPYGHGRVETLTGLLIGLGLAVGGALICYGSLLRARAVRMSRSRRGWSGRWSLSLLAKSVLAAFKFRYGRKLKSDSLKADAWNDAMDTLSAVVALGRRRADAIRPRPVLRRGPLRRLHRRPDRHLRRRARRVRHRHATHGHDARRAHDGRRSAPPPPAFPARAASRNVSRAKPACATTSTCTWKSTPT